jgi:hypothetical protein
MSDPTTELIRRRRPADVAFDEWTEERKRQFFNAIEEQIAIAGFGVLAPFEMIQSKFYTYFYL